MEQIKTLAGDVVQATSPAISEQEAIENASFGKYSYDPSTRLSTVSLPGWQGYSTSQNPNGFYGGFQPMGYIGQAMNGYGFNPYYMNSGIGSNPYMMGNQYGSQPVYQGYGYNPAFAYIQQQQQMQQPQYVQIPPLNYRGEFLPPKDYDTKLSELSNQFWMKEQEQLVENRDKYNYNNFGYNYYGNLMYGFYSNPVRQEANNIIQSMQQEARENRIQFNMNLGKLAFNLTYGKGNYDENKLEDIYRGRTIENPVSQNTYNQLCVQNRFANCVPFDNSMYYQNFHTQVTAQHNSIIDPNSNMKEAFDHAGELWAMYEMEEEQHRRRNLMGSYNSDGYKYFIQKSIAERKNRLDNRFSNIEEYSYNTPMNIGGSIPAPGTMNIYTGNPRKMSHVDTTESIDKDGNLNVTLSLPVSFGSKAGSNYIVNSHESAYDKKREEFNRFIDSIPGSIYGNKSSYNLQPGGG